MKVVVDVFPELGIVVMHLVFLCNGLRYHNVLCIIRNALEFLFIQSNCLTTGALPAIHSRHTMHFQFKINNKRIIRINESALMRVGGSERYESESNENSGGRFDRFLFVDWNWTLVNPSHYHHSSLGASLIPKAPTIKLSI